MPIPTGTRLGPYEIVSPLGAGGMDGKSYASTFWRALSRLSVVRGLK